MFCCQHSALEEELALARQERDTLNQQLLNTIRHKVALSQEVESWQVREPVPFSYSTTFRQQMELFDNVQHDVAQLFLFVCRGVLMHW